MVALPIALKGHALRAGTHSALGNWLALGGTETDRVLVIIQMAGGNDGLNTVIPMDQMSAYQTVRPHVALPENSLLPLTGTDQVKLHPALGGLRDLYNQGHLSIVQNVGYPDQDYSHFRSMDIWMSGSSPNEVINTGWAGRYLGYEFPNFPNGFPNETMPDPLAIEIGWAQSLTFQGGLTGMSMTISDPDSYYDLLDGIQTPAPATPAGDQLTYIRLVASQADQYGKVVKEASEKVSDQLDYPEDNPLAEQLQIVARLIAGGLKTRVYMVSMGGFDTHDSQVEDSDHTQGEHAQLLGYLGDAVKAFQDDLNHLGISDRVLGVTMSEFGRRIISNASLGTDHGAAAPLFFFGKPVEGGILGDNPFIPLDADEADNLPHQVDFRSVYHTLLKDWFCVPETDLSSILLDDFPALPTIQPGFACLPTAIHDRNQQSGDSLIELWPNPFTEIVNVKLNTGHTRLLVQVINSQGKTVGTLYHGWISEGTHSFYWNSENLPAGMYYLRIQNGAISQVKPIIKAQ